MRRLLRRRALAEIVGTLMLVLIVVAAAVAFSVFVAAYQKQLQAEQSLNHARGLESIRVISLTPHPGGSSLGGLDIELASLDVNPITIRDILVNDAALLSYSEKPPGSTPGWGCLGNGSCLLELPPFSQVTLCFNLSSTATVTCGSPDPFAGPFTGAAPTLTSSTLIQITLLTSLGNDFVQSFVPPVALLQIGFSGTFPVLDGSDSYQPTAGTGTNFTIDVWSWTVASIPLDPDDGSYYGQQAQLAHPFASGTTYNISLVVTNTLGLTGNAKVSYPA